MLLGRYEVIRKIGVGGFGEVLLARAIGAEGFERVVALKRLKGDLARKQGSLQGIINEARIGGMLNHPNVVQVLEFVQLGPDYLLVMEYVDGIALQEILELDHGPTRIISPGLAIDIILQACEGLHYAHSARAAGGKPLKLIHRDIKPSNLMLTRTGTLKIMDFGVARSSSNLGHSTTGSIKGTLRYLSPEQAEGSKEIGHESDLFSLGLVLTEMIIGHPVYEADQEHLVLLRALQARTGEAVKEAEALGPGLGPILTRCLDPSPDKRYATAEDLAQALRALKVWFPVEYGLPALVERVLNENKRFVPEDETNETSFSLELRQKGLDRQRPGWEMLATQDARPRGAGPAASEPPPPPSVAAAPPSIARLATQFIPDLLDEAAPHREMIEAAPSTPPSRTWEWEWHITNAPAAHSELDDFEPHEASFDDALAEAFGDSPRTTHTSQFPDNDSGEMDLEGMPEQTLDPEGNLPSGFEMPAAAVEKPIRTAHQARRPPVIDAVMPPSHYPVLHLMAGLVLGLTLLALGFLLGVQFTARVPDLVTAPRAASLPLSP